MADNKKLEQLKYDDKVRTNNKGKAVLGTLEGPCAEFIAPTRNGRYYSEELWEKVFQNPLVKEQLDCGGIFGELGHPEDRDETDATKIAICMPEAPKKDGNGRLIAKFDILDTPNGRIAKTLCDYGYKFGISSRGSGDVSEDYDGNEVVEPSTYDFKAFDLVLIPAVKNARLHVVESLGKPPLKVALKESLEKETDEAKKVITETLQNLNIDIEAEEKPAVDDAQVELIKSLQEAIEAKQKLELENRQLQEKLSVCYAKEVSTEEELQKYKNTVISLSESAKKVKPLETRINSLEEDIKLKSDIIDKQVARIDNLKECIKKSQTAQTKLNEQFSSKDKLVESLKSQNVQLKEDFEKKEKQFEDEKNALKEDIEKLRSEHELKEKELNKKIQTSKSIAENWKKFANNACDYYIKSRAKALGVESIEIKNRLSESFTFEDVDRVCNDIKNYQLNISKLPFDVKKSKIKVTESKETVAPLINTKDDAIDNQLVMMAQSLIKK